MRPERHVIQERDDDLVAELFRKHGEQLARHLTAILGSPALAQDAVQDTYERFCTLDLRTIENPPAYLFQAGTRFALAVLRRRKLEAKDILCRAPLDGAHEHRFICFVNGASQSTIQFSKSDLYSARTRKVLLTTRLLQCFHLVKPQTVVQYPNDVS